MFTFVRSQRRNFCGVLLLLAQLLVAAPGTHAEPIQLRPTTNFYVAGVQMDLGDYAIPCVTDWNGDGRKDLLVGYRFADKIAVFMNVGTEAQPALANSFNLQAGGADIVVPGSSCGAPAPWVCDYDRDGKRDLLVGEGASPGRVHCFANTNTDAQPLLAPGVPVMLGGNSLMIASGRATPFVCDWDNDGLPDLLSGSYGGAVYFFRNTNAVGLPAYASQVQLQAAGQPLSFDARSVVRVMDWDNDGLKDLVGSSSAGVYWCRNAGNNSVPVLGGRVAISAPMPGQGLRPIYTSSRMRLDLADWNNDGVLDLLLGNADGTVALFEGYWFQVASIASSPDGTVSLQWQSAPHLKYHVLTAPSPETAFSIEGSNLSSAGNLTSWTNPGFAERRFHRVQIAP